MPVVVATRERSAPAAESALAAHGATVVERRPVAPGRVILVATAPDADAVVAVLRSAGWRAAARPETPGHLAAWRSHTAPVEIEGRLCVCFPWSEFDRAGAPPAIEIDPGAAFGTGAHPSTRLLLGELARRVGGGDRVLDVGCGTGVLAIGAARLGAEAMATDIDPSALEATARNAEWNEVDVDVHAALPDAGFDVVLANIGADELVRLAPELVARVAPGGWIGLSGLSPAQVSRVGAAYPFPSDERRDGEWAALILRA